MQNSQGYITAKLQSQCVALTNENTYLRGRLEDSVSLDEHMAVVDALSTAETRIALMQEENERLRKEAEENARLMAEKDRKMEDMDRKLQDMKELKTMLEQKNCDAKSVVELLTRCIFGRSSEKSGLAEALSEVVVATGLALDLHDADRFVSGLAGFAATSMAMAGPDDLNKTDRPANIQKNGRKPSKKKKDGSGGQTTSRNAGQKRNHDNRMRHGFETIASELDQRFGITYERYGKGIGYTIKKRNGKPDQWYIRIAFMTKPRTYFKEYTVAGIYSRELGDDTSDRPSQIVDGCPYSASFAAYYLTMKFAYNLSEKKIIRMLGEMGCRVKQSTLNKWMHRVMRRVREAMAPVLMKEVQSSGFMHNDETRILVRVWNEEKQKEEYKTCYIHGAYAPDCKLLAMVYENGSREAAVIEEAVFRDFKGEGFTADRCPIYDVVSTDEAGNLILAYGACWTHARRYCLQAFLSDNRFAGVMKCINVLFSIEKHCRIMEKTAKQRLDFRKQHATAIVDSIFDFMRMVKDSTEYGELAKRAANYLLNGEEAFRAFLRNGYIELENNAIERLFRHLATGRRNWTHSGSHGAAKNIAFMYSLYESCTMNDVNFSTYIEEVLTRITNGDTNYRDMLPNRITLPSTELETVRKTA